MSSHPQLPYLVGQAVNHVIGQMAMNFVQGGSWEIESVNRGGSTASVVFAVGNPYETGVDDRPRITIGITAHSPETTAILSDPELVAELYEAKKDVEAGLLTDVSDLLAGMAARRDAA